MIRSFTDLDEGALPEADAVVIGAGIAGLVTARDLASKGWRVLVLETGGRSQDEDEHELNEVVSRGMEYGGVQAGRFRCLGGTSTRWGGALIPFLADDLKDAGWPVSMDQLTPFIPKVEQLFGLGAGAYDAPELLGGGSEANHLARFAKWPTFKRRNVARLLDHEISSDGLIDVVLGAHVTGFTAQEGKLTGVKLGKPSGGEISLPAPQLFICAGAIESTRLMLLLNREMPDRLPQPDDVTGRYFHDHLSCATGQISVRNAKAFNKLAGFRFEGETMRNLRFELAPESPLRRQLPPQFHHIAFVAGEDGGFAVLRDLFRDLQRAKLPSFSLIARFIRHAPWLVRAAWWRLAEKRVLAPAENNVQLVTVTQQEPRADSRISLSPDQTDRFGVPLAQIDWSWSQDDVAKVKQSAEGFAKSWQASPFAKLADLTLLPDDALRAELGDVGGIYHPCGSTRMGTNPSEGSVDDRCRVFGLDNLRVFSTSVMPTSGGANPTMMMLLLALRSLQELPAR